MELHPGQYCSYPRVYIGDKLLASSRPRSDAVVQLRDNLSSTKRPSQTSSLWEQQNCKLAGRESGNLPSGRAPTGWDPSSGTQDVQGHVHTFPLSELIDAKVFFPTSLPLISSLSLNSLLDTPTHAHTN